MHPTPDLSHLSSTDYEHVYEPAEDTFLFLDALEKDIDYLRSISPQVCMEVGSGSGCVSAFLSTLLGGVPYLIATDINSRAAQYTSATAKRNNAHGIEPIVTNLLSGAASRLKKVKFVDVLLFNPPYVVTPSEDVGTRDIVASWAGGENGREVTDRLLPHVPEILSENGCMYLVVLPENKPEEMIGWFTERGFGCVTVESRKSGREKLSILRFSRKTTA